jgi:hypothetical protein
MKRLFHIGVITLLLAGSWGTALAASCFCPRAQDHACCRAEYSAHEHGTAPAHDGMEMSRDEMTMTDDGMTMTDMKGTSPASVFEGNVGAVEQPAEPCPHCMGHSGVPVRVIILADSPGQSARGLCTATPEAHEPFVPLASSYAPPVISRQHAPPTALAPRHVLIGVFLI